MMYAEIPRCPICGRDPDLLHMRDRRVVQVRCAGCNLSAWRPYGPKTDAAISAAEKVVVGDWYDLIARLRRWKGGKA